MSVAEILIDGDWRPAQSGTTIAVLDPSDGAAFTEIASGGAEDINRAVASARKAFENHWSKTAGFERGRLLRRLGDLVDAHHDELAELESRDTGKPLKQSNVDATVAARYFEFYGGAADKLHGDTIPFLSDYQAFTLREPFGVTGHIIPWNYPLQMGARTIAATLAAGNAMVLKPSEEACLSVLRLAELALEAGIPPDAINVVTGYGEEAGAALAAHAGVDHVSFTGSPEVGTLVQRAAATHNVSCTMELGGKSPQIVFADADFEAALPVVINAIVQNAGQTCSAGSRLLIEESAYGKFVDLLSDRFSQLRAGPAAKDLDCGPLISETQRARVNSFLERAHDDGVPIIAEASLDSDAKKAGFFVPPVLFGPVPDSNRLAREEVFGPVLSAIRFDDEEDAIRIANGTAFGLTAGVWTENGGRQLRVAKSLRCGQVFINSYGAGGGVELPFGGMKRSGHGREKGLEALHDLTTVKTIVLRHG